MNDDLDAFLKRSRSEQDELLAELHRHQPRGLMRPWVGRTSDKLQDATAERVSQIEREIARIERAIEFVGTVGKAL